MKYCLLKQRIAQRRKMFLWCLIQLERRLMMMIKILRTKLPLNFVGPQGHVPHQSGTATLSWKSCCWTTVNLRTMKAMAGPDSNKWLEAMKSEIGSMYENKV